ncbi:hypothetical protein PFISCL1PPCAC_26961 [Pristionchus fissidentatus]|uniref:Uncharacterized protein n=1 Tax=Pristionchus fissidentatus TaxID=1538716 RepID=A0AAV5X1L3_9BILA|nr:hypothetical protein PFISCL1PPCAC_26961 [Pristionchus fissidentatus]
MAESERMETEEREERQERESLEELRKRGHSFHATHIKTAPKRPAVDAIDETLPSHRQRLDEHRDSSDSSGSIVDEATDTEANPTGTESPESLADPSVTNESPEVNQGRPRIVRPEDISLHNPDSGIGFRGTNNAYLSDDSDEEESEKEDGEVTEPDDSQLAAMSSPDSPSPIRDESSSPVEPVSTWVPRTPSPLPVEEESSTTVMERAESPASPVYYPEENPYTRTLSPLKIGFDPTEHIGLLMIDPSHQPAFFAGYRAQQAHYLEQHNRYFAAAHAQYAGTSHSFADHTQPTMEDAEEFVRPHDPSTLQ